MAFLNEQGLAKLWSHILNKLNKKISLPEEGSSYKQLVTDGNGETVWEDRLAYTELENVTILPENTYTSKQATVVANYSLIENQVYTITYNGNVYNSTAIFDENYGICLGNLSKIGLGSDTTEPFVLFLLAPREVGYIMFSDSVDSRTLSVFGPTETNTIISGKYLPGNLQPGEGYNSVVVGDTSSATGTRSLAIGSYTEASGEGSVAEGLITKAQGIYSHAEGENTIASGEAQHAQGKYNIEDTENKYAHIVGNGTAYNARSNAHTIDWDGIGWFAGGIKVGGAGQDDETAQSVVLAPSAATAGQALVVKSVDENGKPIDWEAQSVVKTCNEIEPDENGNVNLSAIDVGALSEPDLDSKFLNIFEDSYIDTIEWDGSVGDRFNFSERYNMESGGVYMGNVVTTYVKVSDFIPSIDVFKNNSYSYTQYTVGKESNVRNREAGQYVNEHEGFYTIGGGSEFIVVFSLNAEYKPAGTSETVSLLPGTYYSSRVTTVVVGAGQVQTDYFSELRSSDHLGTVKVFRENYAPENHASADTTYGVSSETNYGHAMASSTTPKANGTASVGSETAKFARGDHIHPAQTSVSGNAGTATKLAAEKTISLTGDASGSVAFDGSNDVSITVTVVDDSHNHIIDNIDGLSTELTGKVPTSRTVNGKALTGNISLNASDVGAAVTGDITNAISAHNSSETSHTDIRGLISALDTRLTTLANSDDTTLDQMSEVVEYIKDNRDLIDGITTSKVSVSDIIDNLTTSDAKKPLSAKQGVALKAEIDTKVTAESGKGLSTNDYTTAEKNKLSGIAEGAEVNQNAFSSVVIGSTTITADTKTDTLTISVGDNITVTPDSTNDTITISAVDTTYDAITDDEIDAICG